jgi:U4/U6 small nuclear ribonucleoprotein PRP3
LLDLDENVDGVDHGTGMRQIIEVPPPADENVVPVMEWWDELFLPRDVRDKRSQSRALAEHDDFEYLSCANCKTLKYIQHPVPAKALGAEIADAPLPMFLTKRERKRIRRQSREEREREKRDMQMMGLVKAPEPKFKLSNFMKVLVDQAVADPSKMEQRVMQQVHERQLMHEMKNLAAKLTPAERREKMRRKFTEDTSRQVSVALFSVKDLANPKHRFKVDVNAQQYNLTGIVLICESASSNMVLVEGGKRGIRKFSRLMLHRIPWGNKKDDNELSGAVPEAGDIDNDEDESEDEDTLGAGSMPKSAVGSVYCKLLWQGFSAKKVFHSFRFQVLLSLNMYFKTCF